ncbi:helix-turn-helix domain-containing protein [Micromonospora ureilytica]|uniref:Transcriptional regulator GlxA family with amidase domain n=1 Tax=Micromonospora ureilytica TaxID=709868 RepID=A0ABS0JK11_9ACTN|nr:transcriptional regulator GlxA family with amidase domain [Micromonospora ureilytica]
MLRGSSSSISHPRLLLETTDLTVDQIAHRSGFGTTAALRQQLHQRIGVAPSTYRRTFHPRPELAEP